MRASAIVSFAASAPMNLTHISVLFASGLALCICARADNVLPEANPYEVISSRNIFNLSPHPGSEAQSSKTEPAGPPVKITANGIMNILGAPQVLFKTDTPHAQQPQKSYILREGQRQDDIEVIHINEKTRLVTFNNHGTEQTIALANAPTNSLPAPEAVARVDIPQSAPGRRPAYLGIDPVTGQSLPPPKNKEEEILRIEAQRAYYNGLNTPEARQMALSLPPTALTQADAYQAAPDNPPTDPANSPSP